MTIQFLSYLGTGVEGIKIFTVVVAVSLVLFFPNIKKLSSTPYPKLLKYSSWFFIISYIVTLISSQWMHWPTVFSNSLTCFVYPYIFWKCLKTKRQLDLAIKIFYYMMALAVFFGLIELVTKQNFAFIAIESAFTLEDFSINSDTIRFGLKRCNSIFSYFSTYGVTSFIGFVLFYAKQRWDAELGRNYIIIAMLCVFAAFSTGSRAVFLGLFFAITLLFVDQKFLKSKAGVFLLLMTILILPVLFVLMSQVLDSMINSDNSKYSSGSSSEMRLIQWLACENYFLDSPLVGNGRIYIWETVKPSHPELEGAESIWYSILVDYGLLGAFAFIYLIFSCSKCLWRLNKRLICLPVGYLLILSLSPDQGIQYNLLITSTIVLLKIFEFKHNVKLS